jgi:rubredoxin
VAGPTITCPECGEPIPLRAGVGSVGNVTYRCLVCEAVFRPGEPPDPPDDVDPPAE